MNCNELAEAIQRYQPTAATRDVARLCLLLANSVDDLDTLHDEAKLSEAWQEISLRLEAATDQHAAMTEELENLAHAEAKPFSADQIWVLVRAIKVQSQILQLYLGHTPLAV